MPYKTLLRAPLVALAALGVGIALTGAASAQTGPTTYTANLAPVPLSGANSATGKVTIVVNGNEATITETASGLAATFNNAPYPHVQHIHGGALGVCPAATRDTNGDKVLSTAEGEPDYGKIQTTLSVSGDTSPAAGTNVATAPSGASFNYSRTITLDAATMASLTGGKAVIVIHGLDPATAAPAATSSPSELVPSLPLAATSPVLCGVLTQVGASATSPTVPRTGNAPSLADDSNSGTEVILGLGALFAVLGAGVYVSTRRQSGRAG